MIAYDLDGTLAVQPPPNVKKWGLMKGPERKARQAFLLEHYRTADMIMNPPQEEFIVITARKGTPEIMQITWEWMDIYFKNRVKEIYFLDRPRTVPNVVEFKSGVIKDCRVHTFYEDNVRVLKGIKRKCPDVMLYVVDSGTVSLF